MNNLAEHALQIWHQAVAAVRPYELITRVVHDHQPLQHGLQTAERIIVVGAGKAGAAMAEALERALEEYLPKMTGLVNVPADAVRPLAKIRLHAARPSASNYPTADGIRGAEQMLDLLRQAGPNDVAISLISGGGSALLPAPDGVTLEEKQAVTRLLHGCGATIHEMNAVRKHLSRIKGGRMAQAFAGRAMFSLIISDVVGDPLDVIASGPTAADESTFADALAVLDRYGLTAQAPAVVAHLQRGLAGEVPETLKQRPANVHNLLLANNSTALHAAKQHAEHLGYRVLNLGSFIEGETQPVAIALAGLATSIRREHQPFAPPVCILLGGETTVTLAPDSGRGGRNQEFVLAAINKLGVHGSRGIVVLSGGTDGEDGPTDAAGAIAGEWTFDAVKERGLSLTSALQRHDAYPLWDALGGLIRTGLTHTNVMDVRVILIASDTVER